MPSILNKVSKRNNRKLKLFQCTLCGKVFNRFRDEVSKKRHCFYECPELGKNQVEKSLTKLPDSNGSTTKKCLRATKANESATTSVDYDFDIDYDDGFSTIEADMVPGNENDLSHGPLSNSNHASIRPITVKLRNNTLWAELEGSMKFQHLAKTRSVARNTIDDLSNIVNEALKKRGDRKLLYSHYISRKKLVNALPAAIDKFVACGDGCIMYSKGDEIGPCLGRLEDNVEGSGEDYAPDLQKVKHISLLQQFAMRVSEKETLELLQYPYIREAKEGVLSDIFDGTLCKRLKTNERKNNQLTIYLSLFSDGFQPHQNARHSLTLVHVVILNFPPSIRTERKYMLNLMVTPGPKAPVDLFSFLQPDIDDLKVLETRGIKLAGSELTIKACLLASGGDIPATRKMTGQGGHTAENGGCKHCYVTLNGRSFRVTTALQLRNGNSYKSANKDISQKLPTPFAELKSFHGTFFFPIDLMHLLGANIGPQIRIMITADKYNYEETRNPLSLNPKVVEDVDKRLDRSKNLIPTTFSGFISDISNTKGKRCVDWIYFLRYTLSTSMLSFFDSETQIALTSLSQVANLICQHEIKESDITQLEVCIDYWLDWLGRMVDQKKLKPNVFTVNQHFLMHLPALIKYLGPMKVYSAFSIETMIGIYKPRIKAKTKIGANAGNVLVDITAENRRDRLFPIEKTKEKTFLEEKDCDMEIWGPFRVLTFGEAQAQLAINDFASKIKSFYRRYYGWNNPVCGIDDTIEIGSGLRTTEGVIFGCYSNHTPGNRESFFVKLTLYVNTNMQRGSRKSMVYLSYFGSVITYFRYRLNGDDHRLLALVKLFNIQKKPCELWPYKVPSDEGKLVVVHVDSIIDLCSRNIGPNDIEYICYPYQLDHDLPFGELRYV